MNKKKLQKIIVTLFSLLLIAFLPLCLSAQVPITVENPSFELPGDVKHSNYDAVPGWSSDSTCDDSGVELNVNATDGDWIGYLMSGDPSVWQLTEHVIAAGELIELKVDVADTWIAKKFYIGLYYDNDGVRVEITSIEVDITTYDFTGFTVSFNADDTPTAIGNKLGIEIQNSTDNPGGSWAGVDNFRLYNMIALDKVLVDSVNAPVVIDGVIDEVWDNVLGNVVRNVVVNTIDDQSDNHGRWKALYDSDYLYLLFIVTDDSLFDDSEGANEHDDGIDIVFDTDNGDETSPDGDDFILTVEYSSTGDCAISGEKWSYGTLDEDGIEAKCAIDTIVVGYDIEVAIPLDNLDLWGDEIIGFGIRINDDDDGGDRDSQIAWYMTDAADWANPSSLADLEFISPTTSIEESNNSTIATEYHLKQNYPNPFNPSTSIEFSLPTPEYVELTVYNILGKEMATLVSNKLNQGSHTYQFDGKNLASGIYYYQLVAGDYREVKKMILLR